jgi:hypothetical protein
MLKLLLILFGAGAGAAGATAYLLSEPAEGAAPGSGPPGSLQDRLSLLKARFQEAVAYGEQERGATEERLRGQIDALRKPLRPS